MTSAPFDQRGSAGLLCSQSARGVQGERFSLVVLRKYQIVSLLDMLQFQFHEFLELMRNLNDIGWTCRRQIEGGKGGAHLDEGNRIVLSAQIGAVNLHAGLLDLRVSTVQAQRIQDRIGRGDLEAITYGELENSIGELRRRIEDELQGRMLMFIPVDKAPYFEKKQLFGSAIESRFPSTVESISEAGKCFACARWTACVFHLMRVVELGVQEFGVKLGVANPQEKNWGNITTEIGHKIAILPSSTTAEKELKANYSGAHAMLISVKDAWRNPTMHPKATYTEDEARQLLDATRSFMDHLLKVV